MEHFHRALAVLLLSTSTAFAEYSICENTACGNAGFCAQECVGYAYGYNMVRFGCNANSVASCLCNTNNGHSSTMFQDISMCPSASACGGDEDATQALNIFSAYCDMNLRAATIATTTKANTAYTSNTGVPYTAGATATVPQATSTSTDSSSSSSSSSNSSNSLSMSDKIAIGCAIGGAVVAIIIAVPSWMHMKKKKRDNTAESQPLHALPQIVPQVYPTPAQQPFFAQPQPQPYYWQHANQGGWRDRK